MKIEVIKQFKAGDKMLQPGDVVDATGWRNVQALIDQRRARLHAADETPVAPVSGSPEKKLREFRAREGK